MKDCHSQEEMAAVRLIKPALIIQVAKNQQKSNSSKYD